jgi:hypothetical protein
VWNAQAAHHYHLAAGPVCRSTLSDANRRRPSAIFGEVFAALSGRAQTALPRGGNQVLRLIDATPVPLTSLHQWAQWNGRTRGLKAHVVYDPDADRPIHLEITAATVNDVVAGRRQPVEPGATYVFDKAYVDYAWWRRLHEAGCCFVTRPKSNLPLRLIEEGRREDADREETRGRQQGRAGLAATRASADPLAPDRRAPRGRPAADYPEQRSGTLRRRDRRALPQAMADRAAVSMDQTASQDPLLSRPQRKRRPLADHRRHDRLSAVAHRRARQPIQPAGAALCRPGANPAVRAPTPRRSRKAAAIPSARHRCAKPTHFCHA